MTNKTYKHFVDGKHVATYKQPNLKRAQFIEDLKTVATTLISIAAVVAFVFALALVA